VAFFSASLSWFILSAAVKLMSGVYYLAAAGGIAFWF